MWLLEWLFDLFITEEETKMAERVVAQGSVGSEIYNDRDPYPSDTLAGANFPYQIAYLAQGAIGFLTRDSGLSSTSAMARELHESSTLNDGDTHLFNQRIQDAVLTKLRIVEPLNFRFGEFVLIGGSTSSSISDRVKVLADPDGVFGLGQGTNNHNLYLDGNDDINFENNSGIGSEYIFDEISYEQGKFSAA